MLQLTFLSFLEVNLLILSLALNFVGVFQNAVSKGVRNISFGDLMGDLGTTM